MSRRVLVLTGTRADFGKMKSLLLALQEADDFDYEVFVTGMHLLRRHGLTVEEIRKTGLDHLHLYANQIEGEPMDLVLANTVMGLARHVHESPPDLLVVHGDRVEALAGAIVGSFRNIRTVHIEGGEVSGTIDGSIRHSVSKQAHLHFVANDEAAARLRQLGENESSIFEVGSPEVDLMLSTDLPSIDEVRARYGLPDADLAVVAYHPVTTESDHTAEHARAFVDALLETPGEMVVIAPNNDEGTRAIVREYERLDDPRFHHFPSLRFEYYLTLLRHARLLVGNSSSGVREAPVYGTPSVNVGNRQHGRGRSDSVVHVPPDRDAILDGIRRALAMGRCAPSYRYGAGDSTRRMMEALRSDALWSVPLAKTFYDLPTLSGLG